MNNVIIPANANRLETIITRDEFSVTWFNDCEVIHHGVYKNDPKLAYMVDVRERIFRETLMQVEDELRQNGWFYITDYLDYGLPLVCVRPDVLANA